MIERINNHLVGDSPAIVVANPGTREERIYLIRKVITSSVGAWFSSDVKLPRGTFTQVIFRLRYGIDERNINVKFFGRVVRSDPEGFGVEFEHF
jgi:hypothetical protein